MADHGPAGLALEDVVRLETRDGVGLLTIERPQKLNAFDDRTARALEVGVTSALEDPDVRVLIITGTGRAFCAGADLHYLNGLLQRDAAEEAVTLVAAGSRIARAIHASPKPVIAAVNGVAVGGGAGLAVACDLRFAADSACIGFVFSRLGLVPDWSSTYFLPRLVGAAKALELFWGAEMVSAVDAERIGLVNRVVSADSLLETVHDFAAGLAAKAPEALAAAKQAAQVSLQCDLGTMLSWEENTQLEAFRSDQAKRALTDFVTRRK